MSSPLRRFARPSLRRLCFLVLLASLPVAAEDAFAQSRGRGTMIMDDGETRRVLHFAEPDVELALEPDVVLSDLRVFERELLLSDAQREAVRRLIIEYLEAFAALEEKRLLEAEPDAGDEKPQRRAGPDRDAEGPDGRPGEDEADPVRAIIMDELAKAGFDAKSFDDLPFQPQISVGVSVGRPADDSESPESPEPPEPAIDVSLSFGSRDDDAMTDEMRETLQAVADRAVPRITDQVRSQIIARITGRMQAPTAADGIEGKWREIEELRGRIDALARARRALYRDFISKVQTLLAEEQLESWLRFDRAFTRFKTLPRGTLDGESTDLPAIVGGTELSPDERDRIAELLEAYELQLHEALRRRNELLETIDAEIDRALYEGKGELAISLADRLARARVTVRNLGEQYMESIAAELTEPSARSLRARVLEESFPRIYTTTIGGSAFEEALELDDLTDEQRTAIETMRAQYDLEVNGVNERIVRRMRKQQANELRESIRRAVALIESDEPIGDEDPREKIAAAFRARQQLDARTMKTLYAMLRPEQVALLPRAPTVDLAVPITAEHRDP